MAKKTKKLQTRNEHKDFRFVLQESLAERCARNPNYSLRSFAKMLDVSPSALSAIINGKRPLTHKMKERLGLKLGLEISDLQKLKSKPHGNSKKRNDSSQDIFHPIAADTFSIISEPHHYALMELMKTENFHWNTKWIAKRLQVTVSEINMAIERLLRVGLLDRNEDGDLFDTTQGFSSDIREGLSTIAQRRFQERSLEKAIQAVQTVPAEIRDNTSMTMAINTKDLAAAKAYIKEFRRRFCSDLEANPVVDEVYQLTISFIPLSVGAEK
ncbi:TIGR02147 family protein [Bdellovibrio sp. HCB288]|uniref:TIGR02147 family protein n=1 Tax=Bdellovibrio sp. HCB288 TaxID=3394355 RepID=UPI0039B50D51